MRLINEMRRTDDNAGGDDDGVRRLIDTQANHNRPHFAYTGHGARRHQKFYIATTASVQRAIV